MHQPVDILGIFISPGHDFKGRHGKGRLKHRIDCVDEVECVAGRGLVGDRYFDHDTDYKGQVTFISQEVIDAVQAELNLADVAPEQMRRNVIIAGVDLNKLIGSEFELGGIRFYGMEECSPCYWMNQAVAEGAEASLRGRGGLRCRVLTSGTLSTGEHTIRVLNRLDNP